MVGKKNTPKATPTSDQTTAPTKTHSQPTTYSQTVTAAAHALQRRSGALTPQDVQILQRTVGNRAVQQLFAQNQPVIQAAGDPPKKRKPSALDEEIAAEADTENVEITEAEAEVNPVKRAKSSFGEEIHTPPPPPVPRKFERDSDMGFWMATSVRAATDTVVIDPSTVTVIDINISPERRATFFGKANGGLQGAHLVAWSAMLRSWNAQLNGTLPTVVTKLQDWLLEDHTAESTDTKASLAPKRAKALRLLASLNAPQSMNTILDRLEHAVTYFIEANQEGTFATQGKSMGGRDEAGSHGNLASYNALDDMSRNALSPSVIRDEALKLIDIGGKSLDEPVLAKVITTWYRMLGSLYPNLKPKFVKDTTLNLEGVDDYKFGTNTVAAWVKIWEDHFAKNKAGTQDALDKEAEKTDKEIKPDKEKTKEGVVSSVRSTDTNATALLALPIGQVQITELDIPDKLRAPTQFGATQQSHTLAWTFLRQSLEKQFKGRSASEAITELAALARRDLLSLAHGTPPAEIVERANKLNSAIEEAKGKVLPLDDWAVTLNRLMFDYVTINQALPTSTYSAAGQALGHGEAGANRAFKGDMKIPTAEELEKAAKAREDAAKGGDAALVDAATSEASMNEVMSKAAKYMDLGQFYLPLLNEIGEYSSYKSRSNKLPLKFNGSLGDPVGIPTPIIDDAARKEVEEQIHRMFDSDKLTMSVKEPMKNLSPGAYNLLGNRIAELQVEAKSLQANEVGTVTLGPLTFTADKLTSLDTAISTPEVKGLQKMIDRLDNIAIAIKNYRHLNKPVKALDDARAANLQKKFSQPAKLVQPLYEKNGYVLRKVVGDYAAHLKYFKPELYKLLAESKPAREKLLQNVLTDPLSVTEVRVGQPIKNYLMEEEDYNGFISRFRAELITKSKEWAETAFTH